MSDLAATNCGCGSDNGCGNLIWIILLLSCCGGSNGTNLLSNNGNGSGCCDLLIILLLLSCCCGGGNGSFLSGNGNGSGCF